MSIKALGDSGWLVEFEGLAGQAALSRVMGLLGALEENRPAGVLDVVPSFASLGVHFEGVAAAGEILDWLRSARGEENEVTGRDWEIAVEFGGVCGPDLAEISLRTGLPEEEVITLFCGATYTVAVIGFSPGFPYLLGLPERLNLPRRATPRAVVSAGSVALAGGQAGIYPFDSPGGWHVLGRTGEVLFDVSAERPARLSSGDRVRFVRGGGVVGRREVAPEAAVVGERFVEVIEPGALTTVQDLGRPGYESSGVSPGGAMDRLALRRANLLVGNPEDAAVLEVCMRGPVLRFSTQSAVALVGASGRPRQVAAGEVVDFSKLNGGVRAALAVAGGFQVPRVLGSMSTDLRAGFGGLHGRALKAGDCLNLGEPGPSPAGDGWFVGDSDLPGTLDLRVIKGVQQDWFSVEAWRRFLRESYEVSPRSDRMGARLTGPELLLAAPREMVSQPAACGSVQVPPDGQPIVLMAERQTIGGYPQIAHVISVDLAKLARAWPGSSVRFQEVALSEARELRRQAEEDMRWLKLGLELRK